MATTMKLIAKTTLGSGASTIDFQNIPATHTDLLVIASVRSDWADTSNILGLRVNNATTNYSHRLLYGDGSGVASSSGTPTYIDVGRMSANTSTASTFASMEVYIPNYAGSTNKSISATTVMENNATLSYVWATAGLWSSTSAIDRVTLIPALGNNFVTNSSAFLYGITKA